MKSVTLVFPHQLFEENPAVSSDIEVFLVEEFLFFKQYNFHRQKLKYHRATMKFYEDFLRKKKLKTHYIEANNELADVRRLIPWLIKQGYDEIRLCEVVDNWLEKRIKKYGSEIKITEYQTPMFLNSKEELKAYFYSKKRYFQTDFYIEQRKKRRILVDSKLKPIGGKWSFDTENRCKYPKGKDIPEVELPTENEFCIEAERYVENNFSNNYGYLKNGFIYPTTYEESRKWLRQFLEKRFRDFGKYQDSIVVEEHVLHHSVLTPMMNIGLLTPKEVVETTLKFAENNKIPLNSLEGFIRQIVGWREFIRGVYETAGSRERTTNFWKFTRKIPKTFWSGETGVLPLDLTIKKVLKTGYCHHIERLMIIGNFMLLCEFHPNEVYKWFMELFIDAYDWVMVPNVYGMSQFADGGLMATKPYISSSNYLMKMSNLPKGDWQEIWDSLFWRFINCQREFFLKNPRLSMLVRTFDKWPQEKRLSLIKKAENFLAELDEKN